jgi:hypothetical protein
MNSDDMDEDESIDRPITANNQQQQSKSVHHHPRT